MVEADHRLIHPNIPGVPWWAAVLIATGVTIVGYAIDAGSGHQELTHIFAGLYIAGCVTAVLAVQQAGVFTAVVQPPLILFCTVPGTYWLFHGGKISNLKELLINCGYPLIERFPLMLGTASGVLLIGLFRWYLGMSRRATGATTTGGTAASTERASVFSSIAAKLTSLLAAVSDAETKEALSPDSQPAHAAGSPLRTSRTTHGSHSVSRTTRPHSRYTRPQWEDTQEPPAERPRHQRRSRPAPARDFDAVEDAVEPPRRARRRPRPQDDPDLLAQQPRETRRDPRTRRDPYERSAPRSSRFDPYEKPFEASRPSESAEPFHRYKRYGPAYEPYRPYDPYEPYQQPGRRATPPRPSNANPTHRPISQVRYRGQASRDEPRTDRRSRSRAPYQPPAEPWEYGI